MHRQSRAPNGKKKKVCLRRQFQAFSNPQLALFPHTDQQRLVLLLCPDSFLTPISLQPDMHQIDQIDENRVGADSKENKVIEGVWRVFEVGDLSEVKVNQDRL